jgi:hypothetical protein
MQFDGGCYGYPRDRAAVTNDPEHKNASHDDDDDDNDNNKDYDN